MKINKSRKSTHTIMAHGDIKTSMIVIRNINGEEVKYIVPEEHIFELSRSIKKKGLIEMDKFFANAINEKVMEAQI